MKKVLFCIPTLFNRPEKTFQCVQYLMNQCEKSNIEYRIYVVNNEDDKLFSEWETGVDEVIKLVSGELYNVGKALNLPIKHYNADYYVSFQDDMFMQDEKWIDNTIELYETESLNCGVIGCRGDHSTNKWYLNKVDDNYLYKLNDVMWSDGFMFFSTKLFNEVGTFDEGYLGDCESQDFNYKVKKKGYTNYWAEIQHAHFAVGFGQKTNKGEEIEKLFMEKVYNSRELFKSKWDSWESTKLNK